MKRMHTVPSNYSFYKPTSGNIMIYGTFAVRLPDGSIDYDNGDGTTVLYNSDENTSSVTSGIHYINGLTSSKTLIKFSTKLTSKPADFWIDLTAASYSGEILPSIKINGYSYKTEDTDIPMVIISENDGIMDLSHKGVGGENSHLRQKITCSPSHGLYEDKGPNSFVGQLTKMGIGFDEEAYEEETEYLFKLPAELYGFDAINGCVTIDKNSLPAEFFDRVKFKVYACALQKILD